MASIQRIVSPLTGEVAYRVQPTEGSATGVRPLPESQGGRCVGESLESANREGRHFPHAAAKRTSFDALAKDSTETVLSEFDERATDRERQLRWWSQQFAGLSLAEVTADRISLARDKLAPRPSAVAGRISIQRPVS